MPGVGSHSTRHTEGKHSQVDTLVSSMAAIVAALKKKRAQNQGDKKKRSFYTPARFGWGQVARDLHPRQTKVSHRII